MSAQHFTVQRPRRRAAQRGLDLGAPSVPNARPRGTMDRLLEADVQRAVLALLATHPAVAFAYRVNSRVLDVASRKSKTGMRPMRTVPKGHPDIAGVLKGGRALYVECKSTDGTLTDEQAAWLARANEHGALAFVARRPDDVLRHLPLTQPQESPRGTTEA